MINAHRLKSGMIAWPGAAAALALAGGFLTAAASAAMSATLNVNNQVTCSDTTGAPYCTIGAAVAKANAGDTVQVAAGTYAKVVKISRSGASGAPILITTSDNAVVTSSTRGFDLAGASWVTINGFTIKNTIYEAVRCTLCSNVSLTNNQVQSTGYAGIALVSSSDMTLDGNGVQDSRLSGIDISGSARISITGGFVTRSGLRISGKSYKGIKFTTSTDSLVDGTEVYNNSDTGIYLLDSTSGVRIRHVSSHDNARVFDRAAAGIESRSADNIVEANITYSNEDSGINMRWGGANGLIVNNITYLNGDHGIDVLQSPSPRIAYNTSYRNQTAGINVEGSSTNAQLFNNISVDNGIGSTRTLGDIRVTTSSMPATADYNIVWGSDGGYVYHWNGTYYRKLTSLRSVNPTVEVHGLQTLPNWVDAASANFQLTSGSPAIDSANSDAIDTPETVHDALGNARCDDPSKTDTGSGSITFADRGALEFVSGCGS